LNKQKETYPNRYVEHHINYAKNKTIMVSKEKHNEIHSNPEHPLYPEDYWNMPGWKNWNEMRKSCSHSLKESDKIYYCTYHDSSVGFCVSKLCPKTDYNLIRVGFK